MKTTKAQKAVPSFLIIPMTVRLYNYGQDMPLARKYIIFRPILSTTYLHSATMR